LYYYGAFVVSLTCTFGKMSTEVQLYKSATQPGCYKKPMLVLKTLLVPLLL